VRVLYPGTSALETMNEGDASELSQTAQAVLGRGVGHLRFAVSDILVQMLFNDPRLRLNIGGFVAGKSNDNFTDRESEELFQEFLQFVENVARREWQIFGGDNLFGDARPPRAG
jgi:hypothetical protein